MNAIGVDSWGAQAYLCLGTNERVALESAGHNADVLGATDAVAKVCVSVSKRGSTHRTGTYKVENTHLGIWSPAKPALRTPEPCWGREAECEPEACWHVEGTSRANSHCQ